MLSLTLQQTILLDHFLPGFNILTQLGMYTRAFCKRYLPAFLLLQDTAKQMNTI